MKLVYLLSRDYVNRVFIETGARIPFEATLELSEDALTPALRAHLVRTVGAQFPERFNLTTYAFNVSGTGSVYPGQAITLVEPVTDDQAVELFRLDAQRWEQAEDRRKLEAAEAQERQRAEQERRAQEQEQRQAAALAETQASVARTAARAVWIATHGSPHLRKCLAGGYDCQRQYALERAAMEHPGYVVDYADTADWRDRSGPSEAALDEAARVGGKVVWLTSAPRTKKITAQEFDADDFEACEAIVIRAYLGEYDLIKAL